MVTSATSAQEAIEKLQGDSYDAVVTDWRLGDGNGRAVVQAAKTQSSMPVVVVSAYVAEAFQATEPLADLYLEKPVNPEELVTIVNELLKTDDQAVTWGARRSARPHWSAAAATTLPKGSYRTPMGKARAQ